MSGIFRKPLTMLYGNRWLISRRTVQIFIVMAFVIEFPVVGQVAAGNLSSSRWFDTISLTDPLVMLQNVLAGAPFAATALIGAALIASFAVIIGGRVYCGWVCPINLVTDAAYWLRQRFNIKGNLTMPRQIRIAVLVIALVLSFLTATVAWEIINPITLFQRELLWTSAAGVTLLLGLFLFDLLVTRRGWCGHLCPVGAFYGLLGRYGRLRVTAKAPGSCNGCTSCIRVCPEPHVLAPVVAKEADSVTSGDCTRCGACLDACATGALRMRFHIGNRSTLKDIPIVVER
jgi:ferredoxin-type protein NapH